MSKQFIILALTLAALLGSVSVRASDFLYYATTYNPYGTPEPGSIVKVSANGEVSPWDVKDAGGVSVEFYDPRGIALDSQGNVFVNDSGLVYKITPGGVASIFTAFDQPSYYAYGIALDASDNVYIQSSSGLNYAIYSYRPNGTAIGEFGIAGGTAFISMGADGFLYTANGSSILRYTTAGVFDSSFDVEVFGLTGFVFDAEGSIYAGGAIDDSEDWISAIYKITFDETGTPDVQIFSNLGEEYMLQGMGIDGLGNIYTAAMSCACTGSENLFLKTDSLGSSTIFATGEEYQGFIDIAMVPEPSTAILLLLSVLGLIIRRRVQERHIRTKIPTVQFPDTTSVFK